MDVVLTRLSIENRNHLKQESSTADKCGCGTFVKDSVTHLFISIIDLTVFQCVIAHSALKNQLSLGCQQMCLETTKLSVNIFPTKVLTKFDDKKNLQHRNMYACVCLSACRFTWITF